MATGYDTCGVKGWCEMWVPFLMIGICLVLLVREIRIENRRLRETPRVIPGIILDF